MDICCTYLGTHEMMNLPNSWSLEVASVVELIGGAALVDDCACCPKLEVE
jgi:hypothetical protein